MSSEQRGMAQIMGGPSGWSYKHSCRVERLEQGTTMSCAVHLYALWVLPKCLYDQLVVWPVDNAP
ncbi:hypothetical protein [Endozoicomonas elysicola]|uniref:hypothetical protein n=1 Tax=Endozoicomonas elysicola TaxID=305900 RepID=UPI000B088C4B|nr:hypothetical protein [Endozoicomonas elysicola]